MRFTCEKQTLVAALAIVQRAMATKSTAGCLEATYLQTTEDGLLLKCMDASMQIQHTIAACIDEDGSTLLPGRLFADVVRYLPEGNVDIQQTDPNSVTLRSGRFKMTLQALEAEDFPVLPVLERAVPLQIPQSILGEMIKRTLFSVATDETRAILTGALLEGKGNTLTMVALDGYRMAIAQHTLEEKIDDFSIVIPAKSLSEIHKLLKDSDDVTELLLAAGYIRMDIQKTQITSRLLEGEFVPYQSILPQEFATNIVINRQDFLYCLQRASLLAKEGRNNLVKLSLDNDGMDVTSQSELGDSFEHLDIDFIGKDLEIAFNAAYFLDIFKAVDQESLRMEFQTEITPCIIKPVEGEAFVYLVLPVRTK